MNRSEYLSRTREFAKRGQELPHSELLDLEVLAIRAAQRQRDDLRAFIAEELSNEALAKKYGVNVRTIERIMSRETWSHLL
jgi:transcriptional regulator GlxA family with amidase domain